MDNNQKLFGFDLDDLDAIADGLETGYPQSVDVGGSPLEGVETNLIPSTTAAAAKFIRAAIADTSPAVSIARSRAISLFTLWWAMVEAERELAGKPIDDDAVILHYMGCGASCTIHAKDLRALCGYLSAGPVTVNPLEGIVRKAVEVLLRNIVPNGTPDREALTELVGIFDGPEYRAVYATTQTIDSCAACGALVGERCRTMSDDQCDAGKHTKQGKA